MAKDSLKIDDLDKNMKVNTLNVGDFTWYDPKKLPFRISGLPWFSEEKLYRRLPKQPTYEIPNLVDLLANCTAGAQIGFRTDATKLAIKVKLFGKADMNHMPATGQCGFDCYIGEPTKQKFYRVTNYDRTQQEYEITFFERADRELLNITLNFPLYQGVEKVLIGIDVAGRIMAPPPYESNKKVIFYGTSITQGGCASRPGMTYTNILSRRFNLEFINLGFSGNGKGEPNMASLIAEIKDPACLVLDYEPNCVSTEHYKETLPQFIKIYRQTHPEVPILVVSKFPYALEALDRSLLEQRLERLTFQKSLIKRLKEEGDQLLYFHEGTEILGEYADECTVDGIHPNDLGFMRITDSLEGTLKGILTEK